MFSVLSGKTPLAEPIILANFSENSQIIPITMLESIAQPGLVGLHGISQFEAGKDLAVEPLDFLVLSH